MKYSLEQRAQRYATKAHAQSQQRRKYTNEPYIVHPAAVADIVRSVSDDEVMLAAAWLHDTVEDTDTTLNDIRRRFGEPVARLVAMLTENALPTQCQSRAARKAAHFRHTAEASADAQTIKLADIIDNTRELIQYDAEFARIYLLEKRLQVAQLNAGNATLRQTASDIIENGIQQLTRPPHNIPLSWFSHQEQKYR
ncbi:GTP pyrophosphokinase [Erwinia sp. OLTSP20]|uniref:HD domain-containing protein n=1 Tax=unclassified Erwinia TaxID=2622719 RepID=UPI000C197F27|nr:MULTISPECIES: HD domain-containing protein [unclassified Erwinia]PIJ50729.1 GTP pyrophosphokinase [Erwinia sp. OAMSP11]PIJ75398.1 GTP pyrophosphokinase [Erwinia sp. OLSSP12]PIJ81896.1 GTP pyrophosphokinase [Erwinia sp. OLCASP19]PIJ84551.1 GTP pyrophosphokinase [Erwinia sp. OLMTSP26]PIJ86898.1 GTP pyrophosphokinase [Erwinia sp. OLMDSP33]